MSGWLSCCDCLQRRAMAPPRRHGAAQPAGPPAPPPQPSQPHGHHNPAFIGDEETATPPSPRQQQQRRRPSEDGAGPGSGQSPPSPPSEQHRDDLRPLRPQFREICDLRDERPTSGGRRAPGSRPIPAAQRPCCPPARGRHGADDCPMPPAGPAPFVRSGDADRSADGPAALPQRGISQLDNIPETETVETAAPAAETTDGGARKTDSGTGSVANGVGTASPPAAGAGSSDTSVEAAEQTGRPGTTGRARAASLGAPRRLAFPRLHRRQRRQSAESAGRSHEAGRERGWLRRLSRGRPSGALTADQPPEQPEPEPEQTPAPNLATRRWGIVRSNFDLDAPLTEHWGFLESVVDNFEKIDAKTYTEHLHEQSPLTSSSSEEEVPDALEAQLLLKLSQAEGIRQRKSPVSRRCVRADRRRRRLERQGSSTEEPTGAAETDRECQQSGAGEDRERGEATERDERHATAREMSEGSSVRPGSADGRPTPEGRRPEPPGAGGAPQSADQPSAIRRASSCPPPREAGCAVPPAGRRQRGSVFGRLLALPAGPARRPSLPAPATEPAPETGTVHHPSWFQQAAGPEAAVGPAADRRALSRRRATVAEVSLREFLEEVDERTHHMQEEEFCGADPHQLLAPDQHTSDDDHVVPLLNVPRYVGLMLADAEKRLEFEYSNPPTPSPGLSPCPTPRRCEEPKPNGAPRRDQAAGSRSDSPDNGHIAAGAEASGSDRRTQDSASGDQDRETQGSSGVSSSNGQAVDGAECCLQEGGQTADGCDRCHQGGQTACRCVSCHQEASRATDGAGCCTEEGQTVVGGADGPSSDQAGGAPDRHLPQSRPADSSTYRPAQTPQAPVNCSVCNESRCRVPAAHAGPGGLPGYLTNIQHEVTAVAESLKTRLQATLSSAHDSQPSSSSGRSGSPPRSARYRRLSWSSPVSSNVMSSATGHSSEQPHTETAKSIPSTAPTPKNSTSHGAGQSAQVGPRSVPSGSGQPPLAGYQQLALAMARQSTVGYHELALALTGQQGAAAAAAAAAPGGDPVCCQAVQTSPWATVQCRSAQTSPGVSTPTESCTPATPTCPQRDPSGKEGPSCQQMGPSAQEDPTCPQRECCTRGGPSCPQCGVCGRSGPEVPPSGPGAAASCPAPDADLADPLPSPPEEGEEGPCSPPSPAGSGTAWTIPASDQPPPVDPAAPPARLLAYGQPSWVARQQSCAEPAELRRRLDSGQRAAGRRRDSLLRRRAERAAEMAAPAASRSGGDHDAADLPPRLRWR